MQQWIISGALRPSSVTAEHIFGHAISSLQLRMPWGLFLSSSRPAASFHALNMAVTLSRSLARLNTLAFTAISFHGLPFCVFSADGMKRDLKGHDVKDLVFMWGFCTNVRATASNMTKLGCEVEDLFELLVKENTIKTKDWATQTKVLKCSKGTEKLWL